MAEYKCEDCDETNRSKFYDGVRKHCKTCTKRRAKEHRQNNIERYRERDRQRNNRPDRVEARRKYAATPEGREAHRRAHEAWIERNGLKRAAHILVGNAVRDGHLVKKPCEFTENGQRCGIKNVEAHHDDYTKPLEVRWLCKKHHDDHHWRDDK